MRWMLRCFTPKQLDWHMKDWPDFEKVHWFVFHWFRKRSNVKFQVRDHWILKYCENFRSHEIGESEISLLFPSIITIQTEYRIYTKRLIIDAIVMVLCRMEILHATTTSDWRFTVHPVITSACWREVKRRKNHSY